jgi:hypothetical protein
MATGRTNEPQDPAVRDFIASMDDEHLQQSYDYVKSQDGHMHRVE